MDHEEWGCGFIALSQKAVVAWSLCREHGALRRQTALSVGMDFHHGRLAPGQREWTPGLCTWRTTC